MARLSALLLLLVCAGAVACGDGGDGDGGPEATDPTGAPTSAVTADAGGASTPRADGASFEELVLASEINPDTKEPITRVRAFRTNDPAMHATIRVKNVPAGGHLVFRWTKGTSVAGTIPVTVPADITESWIGASIRPNGPIPVGDDWLLAVSYNGEPVDAVPFSVQ